MICPGGRKICRGTVLSRLPALFHQLKPLHDSEAVLLVNNDQPQFGEVDFLLDQGMRADNQIGVALADVAPRLTFSASLERSGQQHNSVAGIFQYAAS